MKKLSILSGILLILILAVLMVKGPLSFEAKNREKANMPLLEQFEKEDIQKIIVTKKGEEIAKIEKKDNAWISVLPEEYPAQEELINIFYDTIKGLKKEAVASKNPEKALNLGVTEETGTTFEVFGENDRLLTHFIVGNQGSRLHTWYVRNANSNDVYEVSNLIFANIDRTGIEWRDRSIGHISEENINTVRIAYQDDTLTLSKDEAWQIEGLESQDEEKVQRIIQEITDLMTMGFPEKKEFSEYGLESGIATIEALNNDEVVMKLIIGDEKDDGQRYARIEEDDTIFILSQSTLAILLQTKEQLIKQE